MRWIADQDLYMALKLCNMAANSGRAQLACEEVQMMLYLCHFNLSRETSSQSVTVLGANSQDELLLSIC